MFQRPHIAWCGSKYAVEIVVDRKCTVRIHLHAVSATEHSEWLTSSAGSPGTQCVSEASRPHAPLSWSRSCSSAAGKATPPRGWTGRVPQKRSPVRTKTYVIEPEATKGVSDFN